MRHIVDKSLSDRFILTDTDNIFSQSWTFQAQKCLETGHGWQGWQPWHGAPDDKGGFLCGRMRHDRHQGFARGLEGQKMTIPRCTHRQVVVPGSPKRKQKWRFRQGTKDRDWKRNQTMVWLPRWVQGERSSSSQQLIAQEADKNERKETGLCRV